MRRQMLYGSYHDKSSEVLQTGASLMRERIRNVLVIVLALVIAALAVIGGQALAYRSEARSRFLVTMQTEVNEAVAQCSSLSRTAGASSSSALGRIRANIHTMDTVNSLRQSLEGAYYVLPEKFTELYAMLDSYSSRLQTGLNTGDLQGDLQMKLEELQSLIAGL